MRSVLSPIPEASARRRASKKSLTLGKSSGSTVMGPPSRNQICSTQMGSASRSRVLLAHRRVDINAERRNCSSWESAAVSSPPHISNRLKGLDSTLPASITIDVSESPAQGERINAIDATLSAGFSNHRQSDSKSCITACSDNDCSASPSNGMPRALSAEVMSAAWDLARTKIAIDESGSITRNSATVAAICSDSSGRSVSAKRAT